MERGIASMLSSRGLLPAILLVVFAALLCSPFPVFSESAYSSDDFLNEPMEARDTGQSIAVDSPVSTSAQTKSGADFDAGAEVFWLIFKIVGFLSLIIVGIFGVTKFLQKSGLAPASNDFMSLHSSIPIGQNQFLRIVRIGKQYHVLGVSSESINSICEISDPELIQDLRLTGANKRDSEEDKNSGFSKILRRFTGTNNSFDHGETAETSFENLQARLRNLKSSDRGGER